MIARTTSTAAALLLLAACGDDGPAVDEDGRDPSGEVLEGSISDAMLPLENVRSQAPQAAGEADGDDDAGEGAAAPSTAGPAARAEAASDEAPDEEPAAPETAEPAAEE